MIARGSWVIYDFRHSPRMIGGVCAELADRSGLPVWLVRAFAVALLLMHAGVMLVVYFGMALWLRNRNGSCAGRSWGGTDFGATARPEPAPPPPSWDRDGLTTRFSRLDRRLADMERAALDREMGLRRAFRDLDGRT